MQRWRKLLHLGDPGLAAQVRAGNRTAIQTVVETYLAQILRAARGAGLDPQQAEDVTQATFTTFIETAPRFEGRSSVRTWLFGILYKKSRRSAPRAPARSAAERDRRDLRASLRRQRQLEQATPADRHGLASQGGRNRDLRLPRCGTTQADVGVHPQRGRGALHRGHLSCLGDHSPPTWV